MFTPAYETIDGKKGLNYKNAEVEIEVNIRNNMYCTIVDTSSMQRLYTGNTPSGNATNKVTIEREVPSESIGEDVVGYVTLYADLSKQTPAGLCIRKIKVKRVSGETLFESENTVMDLESGFCLPSDPYLFLEAVSYNAAGCSEYRLSMQSDKDAVCNRVDIIIELTFDALTDEELRQTPYALMQSMPVADMAFEPTEESTVAPTTEPTFEATAEPTVEPTVAPTAEPTFEATAEPTVEPTAAPTDEPATEPAIEPTNETTAEPTDEPTVEPTVQPADTPAGESPPEPTAEPTAESTVEPAVEPATEATPETPAADEAA